KTACPLRKVPPNAPNSLGGREPIPPLRSSGGVGARQGTGSRAVGRSRRIPPRPGEQASRSEGLEQGGELRSYFGPLSQARPRPEHRRDKNEPWDFLRAEPSARALIADWLRAHVHIVG